MPIVSYKQPIDAVRGTLGTGLGKDVVVFNSTKNPGVMRAWVKPSNPRTTLQEAARAALTASSQAFKALGAGGADAWNSAAAILKQDNRLDLPYNLSGINLYVRINTYRILAGLATTPTPPTATDYPIVETSYGSCTSGSTANHVLHAGIKVTDESVATTQKYCLLEVTNPWTNPNRQPRTNDFSQWDDVDVTHNTFTFPSGTTAPIVVVLTSTTRELKTGDTIIYKITPLSPDFVPGPPTTINYIVQANP